MQKEIIESVTEYAEWRQGKNWWLEKPEIILHACSENILGRSNGDRNLYMEKWCFQSINFVKKFLFSKAPTILYFTFYVVFVMVVALPFCLFQFHILMGKDKGVTDAIKLSISNHFLCVIFTHTVKDILIMIDTFWCVRHNNDNNNPSKTY